MNKILIIISALALLPTLAFSQNNKKSKNLDSLSYSVGLLVADNLKKQGIEEINLDDFKMAMKDVFEDTPPSVTMEEAQAKLQKHIGELQAKKAEKMNAANLVFFAENAKKEGVQTTASGLQYEVIKPGTGKKPAATDKVKVHYEGKLLDGTVFDSSYKRGEPTSFPVNGVIQGWQEALQLMPVGSKWRVFIPQELAYGARGAGQSIPPFSALIFEVELLEIVQ